MSAPFIVSQGLQAFPPPDGSAPSVDAGVLGLEARHTWYGEYGPVRLNHLWDDDGTRVILAKAGTSPPPNRTLAGAVYKLMRVTGLHSRGDADDNRANLTGRIGEVTYPSFQRGKTITYEGVIAGATLADLRRAETQLRRAVAGTYESFMLVEPHPSYGNVPYAYFARAMQLEILDEQTAAIGSNLGPHQRTFTLAFRQSDPRYYVWQQRTSSANSDNIQHAITNQGGAPTDPTITIHPLSGNRVVDLEMHNDTTGAVIALDPIIQGGGITSSILSGVNGYVTLNFRERSIRNETGYNLLSGLDPGSSTWWDEGQMGLAPGVNLLRMAYPVGGTFDVAWLDASW